MTLFTCVEQKNPLNSVSSIQMQDQIVIVSLVEIWRESDWERERRQERRKGQTEEPEEEIIIFKDQ